MSARVLKEYFIVSLFLYEIWSFSMNGTLIFKSGQIFEIEVTNIIFSGDIPTKGRIDVTDNVLEQFSREAKELGSWDAVKTIELSININGSVFHLDVLIDDLPLSKSLKFRTTVVLNKD